MKKVVYFIIGLIVIGFIFINATSNKTIIYTGPKYTSETYQIKALKLPENLDFAGEPVPLQNNDTKERFDREFLISTYWQSNGLLMIKRAHKYFPIIEPILKQNGVPDDFKYLAVIESGLINVSSPRGAKGFWQLMEGAALDNNLEVNQNVDERYNLEISTQVACQYILKAKEKLGSWTLAAASYNSGITGMKRFIDKQNVTNYYDLWVSDETARYIPKLIAVKEILRYPERYGFIFEDSDLYYNEPTQKIEVDTPIQNLVAFAEKFNVNFRVLKLNNPWLRENDLKNPSNKKYYISIPK